MFHAIWTTERRNFFLHSLVRSFIHSFRGAWSFLLLFNQQITNFLAFIFVYKAAYASYRTFFLKQKICIKCMRRMLLIMCSSYQRTISPLCEYVYARAAKSSKFVMMMIIIGCCRWFAHFVVFTFVSGMRCYCLFTYEKKIDTFAPYNKINSLFENRNHFIE